MSNDLKQLPSDTESAQDLLADIMQDDLTEEEGKEKVVTETEGVKKEEKKEKEETDEEKSDEELELDGEEEPEIETELVVPVKRKEILAKFPTIFKEFPFLEQAYYREQQFTELFPTPADAKEALEKAQVLDNYQQELLTGNTETIIKLIKENDPNAFAKLVDDYLPTLHKVDPSAYAHVVGNFAKNVIQGMVAEAKNSSNEELQSAAQLLHQFLFGNTTWQPPTKLSKEAVDDSKKAVENERNKYLRERFESTVDELGTRVDNTLKSTIDNHIDPKKLMSDYVRKNAVRDCLREVHEQIGSDSRFAALRDKLWEDAMKNNFSRGSLDRIKSAYLTRAKVLLPQLIQKTRNEALKGVAKRVDVTKPREAAPNKSAKVSEIPTGMSTKDWLMQD